MKFMNLAQEYSGQESNFLVLPISYEKDLTYGAGAARGAKAILEASKHLEYYEDQFDCEPFSYGIRTLKELELSQKSPEEMIDSIRKTVAKELSSEQFLIGVGGDHAVTIGTVAGLREVHGDEFSIIQFDAHADFRDSWNGSSLNHACVAKQLSKQHSLLQVGIRAMDIDEHEQLKQSSNVTVLPMHEFSLEKFTQMLANLKQKVFITIDVDAFDPSVIRSTGTPEPMGMMWQDMIEALKVVFSSKTVLGADLTEFAPVLGSNDARIESYCLARLLYKIMGMSL